VNSDEIEWKNDFLRLIIIKNKLDHWGERAELFSLAEWNITEIASRST
jgi:hypothetical protein